MSAFFEQLLVRWEIDFLFHTRIKGFHVLATGEVTECLHKDNHKLT
jgi:hypothetical protein